MVIDIHTHITCAKFPQFVKILGRTPFKAKTLLMRMDMEGIDRSVVLPLANPENIDYFGVAGNQECIEACHKHPDRFIPFCNIDPRSMLNTPTADLSKLIAIYKDLGCRGIGEVCANLPITDPRYQNLFHHAGLQKLPVLMHVSAREGGLYGVIDELHLPGLAKSLKRFPSTLFIGHAPSFWNEIDGLLVQETRETYPKGPIKKQGRLWKLMDTYANLYGDLSAGSAYNAISRDPGVGYRFLQKFNRNLFFGTDRFTSAKEPIPPMLPFLHDAVANKHITKPAYENIMHRNFTRIFGKD